MFQLLKNLNLNFSWKWNQSPSALSKNGNAQANSGSDVIQQNAGGDINNFYPENKNPIDDADAWKELLGVFASAFASKLIEGINDPRSKQYFDHNVKGQKNFVKSKFNNVHPHPKIADELVEIYEKAVNAIDSFVETGDEESFKQAWKFCYESLSGLREVCR